MNLGYRWKRTKDNRKVLVEKPAIICQRLTFYNRKQDLKQNDFRLVYIDETWIDTTYTAKRCWQSKNSEYDQEIPQSHTTDNPTAPRGRAAQPSREQGHRRCVIALQQRTAPDCRPCMFRGHIYTRSQPHLQGRIVYG